MMAETMMELGVSHRQACSETGLARSTQAYKQKVKRDEVVVEQLHLLVEKHPSIGFWQSYYRIRRKGFVWNHKKVYRGVYRFEAQYPKALPKKNTGKNKTGFVPARSY